jgi:hypothetical protein
LITKFLRVLVKKVLGNDPKMSFSPETAERVALKAAVWLAQNDELLPVFMGATGSDEASFRTSLGTPEFQASVLDFLMMDDAWVIAFCDTEGLPYDSPMQARAILPGAEQVHWT